MSSSPTRWPWTMVVVMGGVAALVVIMAIQVLAAVAPLEDDLDVLGECVEHVEGVLVECDR